MIIVYKEGDKFDVKHDCQTITKYLGDLLVVMGQIEEKFSDDLEFQIDGILPHVFSHMVAINDGVVDWPNQKDHDRNLEKGMDIIAKACDCPCCKKRGYDGARIFRKNK